MKKTFVLFAAAMVMAAAPVLAADKTWNGAISDSMCGAKHPGGEHDGKKMTDADCAKSCINEHGGRYVFVSEGKVRPSPIRTLRRLKIMPATRSR